MDSLGAMLPANDGSEHMTVLPTSAVSSSPVNNKHTRQSKNRDRGMSDKTVCGTTNSVVNTIQLPPKQHLLLLLLNNGTGIGALHNINMQRSML